MSFAQRTRSALRGLAVPMPLARAWAPLAVLAAGLGAHLALGPVLVLAAAAFLSARALDSLNLPLPLLPFATPIAGGTVVAAGVGITAGALALAGAPIHLPVVIAAAVAGATGAALARLPGITDPNRPVRTAVIGSPELAVALANTLGNGDAPTHGIVGFIGEDLGALGSLEDIEDIIENHEVELLVYGRVPSAPADGDGAHPTPQLVERVTDVCLARRVGLIEASQLFENVRGQVPLGVIDGRWFGYLIHPKYGPGSAVVKRAVDLVVAGAMAIVTAPLMALAAIAIKITDGGPVLYRQHRVGATGATFSMPKLRTMVTDAEREGQEVWCRTDDDRITAVGRILRRCHIDELPQLWSVIRGDMSLVGPRPERPQFTTELHRTLPHYNRRHFLKPGLTGWAQVRCGYAGSVEGSAHKLSHDLYYLKHRSIALDLMILVETARTLPRPHSFRPELRDESFVAAPAGSPATEATAA